MENTFNAILTIWGAILSSFLLGWSIYRDLTDKGKIKLDIFLGNLIELPLKPENKETKLCYHIVNSGRKPTYITGFGAIKKDNKGYWITPHNLPKTLEPGGYIADYTHEIAKMLHKDIKYLYVSDSLGKKYKFKGRKLNKLKKQFNKKEENK